AELFGIKVTGDVEGPMKNSYLRVHPDRAPRELRTAFGDAERFVNGVYRLPVECTAPLPDAPVTLVPAYPDLPMEEVYPRILDSGHPELILRQVGKGRVAYFPWDIDRTFWELLNADHGRLLAAAVDWASGESRPAIVTGPGMIDLALWRQPHSIALHIVNLTNPMTMRGSFREIIPIGAQRVEIRLPEGGRVTRVRTLTAEHDVPYEVSGGVLRATIPGVDLHEILAVDLA
ncbi:MAG TPA: hypothetical protein VMV68_05430, partial [Spirochaetia bacterium]|nr:hypothetical protein [Spirochaetia bacterium]